MTNQKNQLQKNKQGFTIIEVVLVLAIAGLIFLMVFIALPALQRSQRDTQRRDDISRLATALTQFQANNGNLPLDTEGTSLSCYSSADKISDDPSTATSKPENFATNINPKNFTGDNIVCKFIAQYMNASSSETNEFKDPNGIKYGLSIYKVASNQATLDKTKGYNYYAPKKIQLLEYICRKELSVMT
ncbi:type II secretion system protein [Candidatus Saccharibacteria bacterium]|nr:type II secretion system protein [Candidatus Saccharibacteria bacterium]